MMALVFLMHKWSVASLASRQQLGPSLGLVGGRGCGMGREEREMKKGGKCYEGVGEGVG